jgi:hypothetical protein
MEALTCSNPGNRLKEEPVAAPPGRILLILDHCVDPELLLGGNKGHRRDRINFLCRSGASIIARAIAGRATASLKLRVGRRSQ